MAFLASNSPVYSPPVPYQATVPGGLREGATLLIQGAVQPDANDFRVDLCTGAPHGDDCVFVYNPRFNQGEVVRNTCSGGDWGGEEKDGGFPFSQGQSFEMKIEVMVDKYRIYINNDYHCEYAHRSPFQAVDCISVEGGLDLHHVSLNQRMRVRASNAPMPFVAGFDGGLQYGTVVIVRGQLYPEPNDFRIDLTCGMPDDADVAFVFNPRFSQGEVVRNTCVGGNWGGEEKDGGFPFSPGENFEVRIDVDMDQYRVQVNGQPFPGYGHRHQPLHCVDTIKVAGDIRVDEVVVQ